jgi:glycosyl transferase family 87
MPRQAFAMNVRIGRPAPDGVGRLLVASVRRLLNYGSRRDGRIVLFAAVAVYLLAIAAGRRWWHVDLWPILGVPPGPSLFFDARNLTAAWECQRLGYDPLYESPCDPWGRPLMYLRPWLLLTPLGLDQSHTVAFAVVLIVTMFVSFALLVGRVSGGTGVALAVAVCSPAVMLAVERANMDVALFSLITASILLWRARGRLADVLSPTLVLLGATAKIYPVFALPAFVMTRRPPAARAALLCIAAFAVYVTYSFRDVAHAAAIATQGEELSYGARILPAHLYHAIGADRWAGPAAAKQLIAVVPLAVIATALFVWVKRRLPRADEEAFPATGSLVALHAGALIYLGTFALANNFDYRLVFLLLTLPQLVEWTRTPAHPLSSLAAAALAAVVLLLWVGALSHWLDTWDELVSWTVAGLLAAVLFATMPSMKSLGQSLGRGAAAGG